MAISFNAIPYVIHVTGNKKALLGSLVDNLDFTDSAGIIVNESNILEKCELMQFMYAFLGDPEFVFYNGFSKKQVDSGERSEFEERYFNARYNRAAAMAAQARNMSPEAFKDPSKFTPDMQSAFNAASDRITADRVNGYLFSLYGLALTAIHNYNLRMKKTPEAQPVKDGVDLRQAAVSYFFALNPQVNPFSVMRSGDTFCELNEEISRSIIEFYVQMCEFYFSHEGINTTRQLLKALAKEASAKEPLQGLGTVQPLQSIFSSTVTHGISNVNTIGKLDKISKSMVVGDVRYISDMMKSLGDAYSLFSYSLSLFTQANRSRTKISTLRVYADTRNFARACRYPVDPEKKDSPEEQKKENLRAQNALMNFVKKLKKNAETLLHTSATFSANVKGKGVMYSGLNLIGYYEITSNSTMIEFTQRAAEYFIHLPIGHFSGKQFLIESRRTSALALYDSMAAHYSMDNNVLRGSENKMKISNLLAHTSYPSIDECKAHKWSWRDRILDRFETDIEYLYSGGTIAPAVYNNKTGERVSGGYFYCGKDGTPIDAEHEFTCFEEFSNCYLCFELADFPSHADRVKAIHARQAESKKKQQKRARRKKENTAPEAQAETASEASSGN